MCTYTNACTRTHAHTDAATHTDVEHVPVGGALDPDLEVGPNKLSLSLSLSLSALPPPPLNSTSFSLFRKRALGSDLLKPL